MDLFTTFVKLANENIPQDRIIDGNDLRSDLGITKPDLGQERTFGRSVYYYRGNLLMAIRHGLYKMHLWTWTTPEDELAKVCLHIVEISRILLPFRFLREIIFMGKIFDFHNVPFLQLH